VVRIDFTIGLERPAQEVFAQLIDLARVPEWQASAVESRADEPLAQGVRIFECRRLMGREVHTELEVTEFDPPRRLTLKALNGPVKFTVDHRLEEEDGGTRLHVLAEGKAGGLMKLGEPALARRADAELRRDFARLKELLERD
jgi:carbon monoxide dehydrogenase subunit G